MVIDSNIINYIEPNSKRWLSLEDLPYEVWKDIKDFEGLYQISSYGRVKSLPKIHKTKGKYISKTKILKCGYKITGYLFVNLYKDKHRKMFSLHYLVANNFIINDNNYPLVMHLDNNKKNNHISNLKFGTYKENIKSAYDDGLHRNMKSIVQYNKYGDIIKIYKSITEASLLTNVSITSISNCLANRSKSAGKYMWKYYDKERESEYNENPYELKK